MKMLIIDDVTRLLTFLLFFLTGNLWRHRLAKITSFAMGAIRLTTSQGHRGESTVYTDRLMVSMVFVYIREYCNIRSLVRIFQCRPWKCTANQERFRYHAKPVMSFGRNHPPLSAFAPIAFIRTSSSSIKHSPNYIRICSIINLSDPNA